jgi:hypothetical protein
MALGQLSYLGFSSHECVIEITVFTALQKRAQPYCDVMKTSPIASAWIQKKIEED